MPNTLSLRTKIFIGTAGFIVLAGLSAIAFAKTVLYSKLAENLRTRGVAVARHMAESSVTPLLTEKNFELEMLIKDYMKSEEDIAYIFILNHSGDVLAHTFEGGFPSELRAVNRPTMTRQHSAEHINTGKGLIVDIAVPMQSGEAGVLHMGFSEIKINKEISLLVNMILWYVAGLSVMGICIAFILSHIIMKPVADLVQAAEAAGRGNLDVKVQVRSGDEIGRLAGTFNEMLGARKKAEEELQKSENKYRSVVESTSDSIYVVDRNYRYLYMNGNHILRMGLKGEEYLGRPYSDFHSTEETQWFQDKVDMVFQNGESAQHEHKSLRDGKFFLQTFSPIRDSRGSLTTVTVVSKDINKLKVMEDKLHSLSITDDLTGLYNRRGFFAMADQHIKLANRNNAEVIMFYADLDGFKAINDNFGHNTGDMVIVDMANILRQCFRDSDIIARIGGDEFVVLPVTAGAAGVDIIERRFRELLLQYNDKTSRGYVLSASLGISRCRTDELCSVDDLLISADTMMYEQKKSRHRL